MIKSVMVDGVEAMKLMVDGAVAWERGSLPFGYQRCIWIGGSNNSYIETDYGFSPTDELFLDAKLNRIYPDDFIVSPYPWNSNNNRFCLHGGYTDNFTFGWGKFVTTKYDFGIVRDTERHISTYKSFVFTLDYVNKIDVDPSAFYADTGKLRLFWGYDTATNSNIYQFKHMKNGVLVTDMIPCLDKNGIPCMFDTVSKKTFYNKGTRGFLYELA